MMTKLWEWLNSTLYVGDFSSINHHVPKDEDEDWSHYYKHEERIEKLKEAMGPRYLFHYSNRVKRVDGKVYGEPSRKPKLRKV
jgi:hypothetical protein